MLLGFDLFTSGYIVHFLEREREGLGFEERELGFEIGEDEESGKWNFRVTSGGTRQLVLYSRASIGEKYSILFFHFNLGKTTVTPPQL